MLLEPWKKLNRLALNVQENEKVTKRIFKWAWTGQCPPVPDWVIVLLGQGQVLTTKTLGRAGSWIRVSLSLSSLISVNVKDNLDDALINDSLYVGK